MARRVLVVDDDQLFLSLLSHYLKSSGYDVLTATSGNEAMHIILDQAPPLVITDWSMPEMDGIDLCRAIRGCEEIRFVYLILITAHSDENRLVTAFDAGADDYLSKPFTKRELLARIRAGERIVNLEENLAHKTLQLVRSTAELEVANHQLAQANDQLHRLVTTDDLTGLGNRRAAMAGLSEHWAASSRHATPLACISIDIDHFKRYNDTHGHAVGDIVLVETAKRLNSMTRAEERMYRVGGEEFLVICPNATAEMATVCAERLRSTVASLHIQSQRTAHRVTVSCGVAQRTPAMHSMDDLLKAADDALYTAKRQGRDRVHTAVSPSFDPLASRPDDPPHRASA